MKKIFELINKNIAKLQSSSTLIKTSGYLPIITISREKGSGGRLIAYSVEKKLGKPWQVYHQGIVDEIAKESKLEKKLIQEVDESNIPLIDELVFNFFGKKYMNLPNYHKHLVKILSTIGNRGYAIIVGRGGEYLFPKALKIRIISSLDQRIKWMIEYEKLTKKQATRIIQESDKKRADFIRSLYGHDTRKAHHYDLVIQTGEDLLIEDAADIVVLAAKKRFTL